jgi:hypothetical protein
MLGCVTSCVAYMYVIIITFAGFAKARGERMWYHLCRYSKNVVREKEEFMYLFVVW